MKNIPFIVYILSALTIISLSNIVLADQSDSNSIKWKKSEYASGYQIQIKDSNGKQIVDEKTSENTYSIEKLKPGVYQMRIGALSPASKPLVWSNWTNLTVKSKKEELTKLVDKPKDPEDSKITDELETQGIHSSCKNHDIPKIAIKECKDDYIVLDLSTKKKRAVYYSYILTTNNRPTRIQAIKFYRNNCKMKTVEIENLLNELIQSGRNKVNSEEKSEIEETLNSLKSCP